MNAPERARRAAFDRRTSVDRGASFARRARRFIADHWIIHVTLIVMAALFVYPFVWMIGMSLKTDEEATNTSLLPTMPTFRASVAVRHRAG